MTLNTSKASKGIAVPQNPKVSAYLINIPLITWDFPHISKVYLNSGDIHNPFHMAFAT